MTISNLYRRLNDDWCTLASSTAAVDALRCWARSEPSLGTFDDPAQLLRRCQLRTDPARSHRLLAAVLRIADGDRVAQRTLLQAVLPGLAALARRARAAGWCRAGAMWTTPDELDQELLTLACERIAALAGQDLNWPAMTILDQVWRRVRVLGGQHRRHRAASMPLDPSLVDETFTAADEPWEQRMTRLLCDAVGQGLLPRADGAVIYSTRVVGVPTAEVAERLQLDVRAVQQRRCRAERRLAQAWAEAA